jgi:type II secretory pathway pseudopilin PulG
MVEIAIALAVIGFALVAIIGVLPIGLEVQKDNREETIVNHDATYFMDAIRSGARGADDLTNYVISITNHWAIYPKGISNAPPATTNYDGYTRLGSYVTSQSVGSAFALDRGSNIIGLLSTPKYLDLGTDFRSNHIVAYVRSLSGPASEKVPQSDTNVQGLAFSYRMIAEVVPVPLPTPNLNAPFTNTPYARNLRANLKEVRLLFRWPLFWNGNTGNGRQPYRAQVGGMHVPVDHPTGQRLYFFEPTTFVNANQP